MSRVITWTDGKKYKSANGGCWDCAFYDKN